jgi:hypothetical protein
LGNKDANVNKTGIKRISKLAIKENLVYYKLKKELTTD